MLEERALLFSVSKGACRTLMQCRFALGMVSFLLLGNAIGAAVEATTLQGSYSGWKKRAVVWPPPRKGFMNRSLAPGSFTTFLGTR